MAPSQPDSSPLPDVVAVIAAAPDCVSLAEQRWVALVGQDEARPEECDVVHWWRCEKELVGYIHDAQSGRIIRADLHPGFLGYERRSRVVTALPGMGWTACYHLDTPMGLTREDRPVLAWLVYDDGTITPQDVDHDGLVYCSTDTHGLSHIQPPREPRSPDRKTS
ncbi:hypothetical protein ACWIG5_34300 [Streptomyces lydicus]